MLAAHGYLFGAAQTRFMLFRRPSSAVFSMTKKWIGSDAGITEEGLAKAMQGRSTLTPLHTREHAQQGTWTEWNQVQCLGTVGVSFSLLSCVNLWASVWLRGAERAGAKMCGDATRARRFSRTSLPKNLHRSEYMYFVLDFRISESFLLLI